MDAVWLTPKLEAEKWYVLRKWAHSPDMNIVYVRKIEGHFVHYVDYDQHFREPHKAEKRKNKTEFLYEVRLAVEQVEKWIQDGAYPDHAELFPIEQVVLHGQYLKRKRVNPPHGLIQMKSITLEGGETDAYAFPVTVTTWKEAEGMLRTIAEEQPGYSLKVDFRVTWDNPSGEEDTYGGHVEVNTAYPERYSLTRHMFSYQSALCGMTWWIGLNPEQPLWVKPEDKTWALHFVQAYDLGGMNLNPDLPIEAHYKPATVPLVPPPEEKPIEEAPDSPYPDRRRATQDERSQLTSVDYNFNETKKIVKADLKANFPNTKFSLTRRRGGGLRVRWWDGPTRKDVQFLMGKYESKWFDGYEDMYRYTYWMVNGQLTSYSTGAMDISRYYREATYQKALEAVCKQYGLDVPPLDIWDYRTPKEKERNVTNWNSPRLKPDPQVAEVTDIYNRDGKYLSTLVEDMLADQSFEVPIAALATLTVKPQVESVEEMMIATRYGEYWELTGNTFPFKEAIKEGATKAKFDRKRTAWVVGTIPDSLQDVIAERHEPEPVAYQISVDGELHLGIWDDHVRMWGNTRPIKDNLKREQFYWNGLVWVKQGTHLPQSMLDWFTYDASYTEARSDAPVVEPIVSAPPKVNTKLVTKLRKAADTLQKQIDTWDSPHRLTNTARRVRQAESAWAKAENARLLQSVLRALADLHECLEIPKELQGLTTKTVIERVLTYPKFPHSWVYISDLNDLEKGTTGKRTNEQSRLLAAWKTRKDEQGEGRCYLKPDEMYLYATLAAKATKESMRYSQDSYKWYKRMVDAGITESSYDNVREMLYNLSKVPAKDPIEKAIKKVELNLVGRKIAGFFPTPPELVERMIKLAAIEDHHRVLEPSAGIGHIAEMLPGQVTAIELVPSLVEVLKLKGERDGFEVENDDIFNYEDQNIYDRVVMNPPFEKYQDVDHVRHVFDHLLKPGGRLVAIMSSAGFQNSHKVAVGFRTWLEGLDSIWEQNPEKSFEKAFRSTGVNTYIVVIDKE